MVLVSAINTCMAWNIYIMPEISRSWSRNKLSVRGAKYSPTLIPSNFTPQMHACPEKSRSFSRNIWYSGRAKHSPTFIPSDFSGISDIFIGIHILRDLVASAIYKNCPKYSGVSRSCLKNLDHEGGIDYLSKVRNILPIWFQVILSPKCTHVLKDLPLVGH